MRAHPLFAVTLAISAAFVTATGANSVAHAESTRQARRWTFSGAANAILPSAGVDLSYQLGDRFAVGGQITSLLFAHVDLSLRTRVFFFAEPTWGLYLGANVHAWYSPLILEEVSPLLTGEIGYEHRARGGFTLGMGLGAGVLQERRTDRPDRVQPVVMANLRIGKSF